MPETPQSARFWPALVVVFLAASAGLQVLLLTLATRDAPGARVEPDYYRRAVEWDQRDGQR